MSYDLVLITGIPGSGKTTVSDKLARELPKAVHISVDNLRTSVKGGFKSPSKPWDEETKRQYYLSFKNAASLANNFIEAGFKVIIDDTLHGGDLYKEWKKYFNKYKYLKILLMPLKESALKRNRERQSHFVEEKVILEVHDNFMKHNYNDWEVIDNTNLTVEETVKQIRKKLDW